MRLRRLFGWLILLGAGALPAGAVILFGSGDANVNTSTPGDNSGWQYEGQLGGFIGTPIAPHFFLTARHIGGSVGATFLYHGQTFNTVAYYDDNDAASTELTDLRIWEVDAAFPTYAPLYQGGSEVGRELRVHGCGAQRGDPVTLNQLPVGWNWGGVNYFQRWGTNVVSGLTDDGGQYLTAAFDKNAGPNEAHLSAGDSGGGVFIQEDGLWKLAAINYGVDDVYTADHTQLVAAIFDARGYFTKNDDGTFTPVPDVGVAVPTSFYSTRVGPRLSWIASTIGGALPALPPENYATWLHGYYAPGEISDPATVGVTADPDGDGVVNLLEFAFNLDPTHAEPAVLTPGSGVRGLPAIRVEGSAGGQHLTIEYVRRTAAGNPGIAYAAQFTGNLAGGVWQASAGETVTAINARWERVKVTDPAPMGAGRFGRVQVSVTSPAAQSKSGLPPGATRKPSGPR